MMKCDTHYVKLCCIMLNYDKALDALNSLPIDMIFNMIQQYIKPIHMS